MVTIAAVEVLAPSVRTEAVPVAEAIFTAPSRSRALSAAFLLLIGVTQLAWLATIAYALVSYFN